MKHPPFEIFIPCRKADLPTLRLTLDTLRRHLQPETIAIATARSNFALFRQALGDKVQLRDEDELIPDLTLAQMRALKLPKFPQAAGWYFQQLLKYAWAFQNPDVGRFLIWDADTILLKPIPLVDQDGAVFMTRSPEHHPPYFETFQNLFGFPANYEFSFIAQHQMVDKTRLREMLASIQERFPQSRNWAWAILHALPPQGSNLFSEYETYGHWMKHVYPEEIRCRDLPWLRDGTGRLGFPPKPEQLEALSRDYYFAAFEQRTRPLKKILFWFQRRLGR